MRLETGWVTYQSAGQAVPAFFARPPGARAPLPAVLLIHEVWGVDEHIEDLAQRFAAAGYEVLAPDLWGEGGARPAHLTRERVSALRAFLAANPAAWSGGEARAAALAAVAEPERGRLGETLGRLFGSDEGRAARFARYTEILAAGTAHLRAQTGAATRRIGAVGFCMGGGLATALAAADPALAATVVFYGFPPDAAQLARITCPVLAHYAGRDPRINAAVPAFVEAMRAAGKPLARHDYPEAPHAFFNDTSAAYRPDAARAAWARTLAFFLEHVGTPGC